AYQHTNFLIYSALLWSSFFLKEKGSKRTFGAKLRFAWDLFRLSSAGLQVLVEQAVLGAVPQQGAAAPGGDADGQVPLRVLADDLDPVPGGKGQKGDVVVLGHGVAGGDIPLILHP